MIAPRFPAGVGDWRGVERVYVPSSRRDLSLKKKKTTHTHKIIIIIIFSEAYFLSSKVNERE